MVPRCAFATWWTIFDPIADKSEETPDALAFSRWLHGVIDAAADRGAEVRVRYLVGVHPYGTLDYTDELHAQVADALDDSLCAGIGEIGLDYHFDADDQIAAAPHAAQMDVMVRLLSLAVERKVPVELHLRNVYGDEARTAHADAISVLERVGGCVLHCFGEDRATMERFLALGCHIAFGGAATFKRNDAVREAFAACPLDRLLLETDCPYMAPEPIRGLECEPAMIAQTADVLIYESVFLRLGAISPSAVPRRSNATTPCGRRSPLVRSTACCWRRTAPIWRPSPFAAWSASRR